MKKILLSLFVCAVSLIGFGYCDLLGGYGQTNLTVAGTETVNVPDGQFYCVRTDQYGCTMSPGQPNGDNTLYAYALYCFDGTFEITCPGNTIGVFEGYVYPKMSSIDCQTEYNLIPIESVDTNYCVENQLCPNECGSGSDLSGDLQYSNLYINNILHPGTQNIFVNIPDYITWDYTTIGDDFNLYVGSGYDVDYINSIVDINSYRPSSGDFTNVFVSGLTLIMPYIVILLFIVFIWKFIKRIFK